MQNLKKLYTDHLTYLREEISSYKNEANIWKLAGEIKNTPGNLCLHICGNLNHFYGATLGNTGYVRDRDLEFSQKNVGRDVLLKTVDETILVIGKVFDSFSDKDFTRKYPLDVFGENVTIGFVISRLIAHLAYHLGQINYHRRIIDM